MKLMQDFYITGGTLPLDATSYVERRADSELFDALRNGDFCYVLTSRQMGKSSLMVRAAMKLRQAGGKAVILDLTALGTNLTPEQWYDGLLMRLGEQLDMEEELEDFWDANQRLGPLQRLMQAIRNEALPRISGPLTIFVDEIDVVRSLPFSTDEFFAAIRELYNARTQHQALTRLGFCLLGVAAPSDLISDPRLTPFNIGRRIELRDFNETEARPLARGLGQDDDMAQRMLLQVLHWTDGHPYLTQRLCQAVMDDSAAQEPAGVDRVCHDLFLSSRSRERDDNLLFVRQRMLQKGTDRVAVLDLYRRVHANKTVEDDETNERVNILRLSGVVRVSGRGILRLRNQIYRHAFGPAWIDANMPDAEKRRQQAAYRRGLIRMGAIAGLIIAVVAGSVWWYLDSRVWDHIAYYNTYIKRFGIMEGTGPLSEKQAHTRKASYQFFRYGRHGPVFKVQMVDSYDRPAVTQSGGSYFTRAEEETQKKVLQREARWEFVRDLQGRVVYEKTYNKKGELLYGLVYSPQAEDETTRRAHFVGQHGYPRARGQTAAEFVEFEYSPQGYEILLRYSDRDGEPQPGLDNAFGKHRHFDVRGLLLEEISVDTNGQAMEDKEGKAITRYVRDDLGNVLVEAYFGADGQPVRQKEGLHKWIRKYDARGNEVERAFFDTDGQPVLPKGLHKWTSKFDARGNEIEGAYFGTDGQPVLHIDGFHKWTAKFDARGNEIETAYFDTDGQPVLCKNGYHKWTTKFDAYGNEVETAYFDTDGQPALFSNDGLHKWTAKFDARGNEIERTYFDTDRQPVLIKYGYYIWTRKYDAHSNEIESAFFDTDGQPIPHTDGVHKWITKFDTRGNKIERVYFDTDGQPVLIKYGYHKWMSKFDARSNKIEHASFDTNGQPVLSNEGLHKWTAKFDARGNEIERAFFGIKGEPLIYGGKGCRAHKWIKKYDAQGNIIEQALFGIQGKPMLCSIMKAHKWVMKYDVRGNTIEGAVFDTNGQPVLNKNGYHKWTTKFDARGNEIEGAIFDTDGQPVPSKNGVYKQTHKYDSRGNKIESAFFDTDEQPVLSNEGLHKWIAKFDAHGNEIERALFNTDGQPVLPKDGYHKWTAKFDARGNETESAFFDPDGQPVLLKSGYHKWTAKFDARGNKIESAFFDTDGQPVLLKYGYHKWTAKFDAHGNKIERAFFDADGQPLSVDGRHKYTQKYDERGNVIEQAEFGSAGEPLFNDDGIHKTRYQYDQRSNLIEESYFDAEDKPMLRHDGRHKMAVGYDDRDNLIEQSFFGVDNEPVLVYGYHQGRRAYDSRNNPIEWAFFNTARQPMHHAMRYGAMRILYDFDESNRKVRERYTGLEPGWGYAELHIAFGPDDKPAQALCLDAQGRMVKTAQVRIRYIEPGHPAEKLDLQSGDIVLRYGDEAITDMIRFNVLRNAERPGDPPKTLEIRRGEQPLQIQVPAQGLGWGEDGVWVQNAP
ncbi:MAG: hypothetical protein GY862_06705 [Gammaproteobacteria bacterium]|nr:hypothetical protein [Gammaproteobacteria bacterium]